MGIKIWASHDPNVPDHGPYKLLDIVAGGDDIDFYAVGTAPTRAKLSRCRDNITTAVGMM